MTPSGDPLAVAATAARGFDVLECEECARAIEAALTAAGHRGQVVTLRAANAADFVICPSFDDGQRSITQNGRHVGVRVGDMAFDNLHPNGMLYDAWLNDFEAVDGVEVASVTSF